MALNIEIDTKCEGIIRTDKVGKDWPAESLVVFAKALKRQLLDSSEFKEAMLNHLDHGVELQWEVDTGYSLQHESTMIAVTLWIKPKRIDPAPLEEATA